MNNDVTFRLTRTNLNKPSCEMSMSRDTFITTLVERINELELNIRDFEATLKGGSLFITGPFIDEEANFQFLMTRKATLKYNVNLLKELTNSNFIDVSFEKPVRSVAGGLNEF